MLQKWRVIAWLAGLACLALLAQKARGGDTKTFLGEIADSQCALNVHSLNRSHKEMMDMKPEIKTAADCARFCVKERGGKFVLQTKDHVYKLDAQTLAEEWVGMKVKVVGTLDPKTDVITVATISPRAAGSGSASHPN